MKSIPQLTDAEIIERLKILRHEQISGASHELIDRVEALGFLRDEEDFDRPDYDQRDWRDKPRALELIQLHNAW